MSFFSFLGQFALFNMIFKRLSRNSRTNSQSTRDSVREYSKHHCEDYDNSHHCISTQNNPSRIHEDWDKRDLCKNSHIDEDFDDYLDDVHEFMDDDF